MDLRILAGRIFGGQWLDVHNTPVNLSSKQTQVLARTPALSPGVATPSTTLHGCTCAPIQSGNFSRGADPCAGTRPDRGRDGGRNPRGGVRAGPRIPIVPGAGAILPRGAPRGPDIAV